MHRYFVNRQSRQHRGSQQRRGTTVVEMAVVLPVFGIFMAGLVEFGHVYMTINTLNAAARKAARVGVADGIDTATVVAKAQEVAAAAFPSAALQVDVKDAAIFDTPNMDASSIDYQSLPTANLSEMEPRRLFLVRITVPYDDVALLPPFWAKNLTLSGQAVMRHE